MEQMEQMEQMAAFAGSERAEGNSQLRSMIISTRRRSLRLSTKIEILREEYRDRLSRLVLDERGDVPGWVLVVLMTTGLVTGIWAVAAPRIESLLRGSLDAMNNVH
jgi:hypothetical protein